MYSNLRSLLNLAESLSWHLTGNTKGKITDVYMGKWADGIERCSVSGTTNDGKKFNLILEVSECQESE